jgi:hypothetical protein
VEKKLHNDELHDLYSSPNIVRVIKARRLRWAGHVARMGERTGVHRVSVGRLKCERPLGRPRRRWVDNIKLDLQGGGALPEMGYDCSLPYSLPTHYSGSSAHLITRYITNAAEKRC